MNKSISILGGAVSLTQLDGAFHTGMDAVMLAAACPAQSGSAVLDLGCGVGAAGLAVLNRLPEATLTGIDLQEDHVETARENADANGMAGRVNFEVADVKTYENRSFDHVICNPPYMPEGSYIQSPEASKDAALGLKDTALEDWVACAFNCLRGRGSFTMIHRGDMVDKVVQAFGKRFGEIEIIPLWPKAGAPAKRVIVRGIKHAKGVAILHPGIVMHQEDGEYTAGAASILKGDKTLLL
ncbi:MAG: methyltransferase [Pseudomonadota bacterium]